MCFYLFILEPDWHLIFEADADTNINNKKSADIHTFCALIPQMWLWSTCDKDEQQRQDIHFNNIHILYCLKWHQRTETVNLLGIE